MTITTQEITATVAESARAQLASVERELAAAGIDITALARAIAGSAATNLGLKLGLLDADE